MNSVGRADRYGKHQAFGVAFREHLQARSHSRARGHTVIDDGDSLAGQIGFRLLAPVSVGLPTCILRFLLAFLFEVLLIAARSTKRLLVAPDAPVAGDGTDGVLGVARGADLRGDDDIERDVERVGDGSPEREPATWNCEHDIHIEVPFAKCVSEFLSRLRAVFESTSFSHYLIFGFGSTVACGCSHALGRMGAITSKDDVQLLMNQTAADLVSIPVEDVNLDGMLEIPDGATGLVVFAHGSGSSRKSPRNTFVAEVIRERGLGTLLFDLLTEAEDQTRENRFDIPLLTDRLVAVTEWLRDRADTAGLNVGYFGSSTGAASALRAAARRGDDIGAVVSRGGRVDMAEERLGEVRAPTLFIVGGADTQVLELNREAYDRLSCAKELHVVEGAGHLFEGEGELEEVADVAADWFAETLR